MKTFVLLLALCAGMFGPTYGVFAAVPAHDTQAAFDYACKVLDYDCSRLAPPGVVWEPLYSFGVLGYYNGDDTIHMDTEVLRFADPVFTQSILAHEIVHYLDVKLGYVTLPYTMQTVCQSEANAWRVGNVYVLTHGRADLARFDWFVAYGCFK